MQKLWRLFAAVTVVSLAGLLLNTVSSGTDISVARLSANVVNATRLGSAPALPSGTVPIGSVNGSQKMSLDIVFAPKDPAALRRFVANVTSPTSPMYRHYLAKGQFAAEFGPRATAIKSVKATLTASGFSIGKLSPDHLTLAVTAKAKVIERTFATSINDFRLPSGRSVFANTKAPLLRRPLLGRVADIGGLSDLVEERPNAVAGAPIIDPAPSTPTAQPAALTSNTSTPVDCIHTSQAHGAQELAGSYNFGPIYASGNYGSGVTVGIYELGTDTNESTDLAFFDSCYGIIESASNAVTTVPTGTSLQLSNSDDISEEEMLDIDVIREMAPDAKLKIYQGNQGSNFPTGPYDTYSQMINDHSIQVISTSWGECEADFGFAAAHGAPATDGANAESTLFAEAAANGQTILAASGDSGSSDCQRQDASDTSLSVDDPASQPNVTGVGGTTLSSLSSFPPSESAWIGGGGGISSFWAMPTYQTNAKSSLNVINSRSSASVCALHAPGASECREVPDVSALADPSVGYLVYVHTDDGGLHGWYSIGGTSGAAPLWASIMTLADAATNCAGTTVGLVNNDLYAIASTSKYSLAFNDITSGNNDGNNLHAGTYPATTGYDMSTGLGTPKAAGLIPLLCAPIVNAVSPSAALAGTTITLTGANFETSTGTPTITSVRFGTASAVPVVTGPTTLHVIAPANTSSSPTVDVTAVSSQGTSFISTSDAFTFGAPTITGLTPPTGSTGTSVSITGSGFTNATAVSFGASSVASASFTSISDTSITLPAPSSSVGQVDVRVTNAAGPSTISTADQFTYSGSSGGGGGGGGGGVGGGGGGSSSISDPTPTTIFTIPPATTTPTTTTLSPTTTAPTTTLARPTPSTPTKTSSKKVIKASGTASRLISSAQSATANGKAFATITVNLRSSTGKVASGKTVILVPVRNSAIVTAVSRKTNGSGNATFRVTDKRVETAAFKATDQTDGVSLAKTITVKFTKAT